MYIQHTRLRDTKIASVDRCALLVTRGARLYMRCILPKSAKVYVATGEDRTYLDGMIGMALERITGIVKWENVLYCLDREHALESIIQQLGPSGMTAIADKLNKLPTHLLQSVFVRDMVEDLKSAAEKLVAWSKMP